MQAVGQLARTSMADAAISAKHKELMALAIGIPSIVRVASLSTSRPCTSCHGSRAELEEMLTVCVYMGGGPALMLAAETVEAWDAMAPAST